MEQVRRLPERLGDRVPVRLRGTVTYSDSQLGRLFLQDGTGGLRSDSFSDSLMLDPGSSVELTGTATAGGSSPARTAEQVRVIGPGVLPQAVHARLRDLLSGKLQYRFVEMEGRVQSANIDDSKRMVLGMDTEGRSVTVLARNDLGGVDYRDYPGLQIDAQGAAGG